MWSLPGYRVSVWNEQKYPKRDGAACITLNAFDATELTVHLKMMKGVHFMLCIFYHGKVCFFFKQRARQWIGATQQDNQGMAG